MKQGILGKEQGRDQSYGGCRDQENSGQLKASEEFHQYIGTKSQNVMISMQVRIHNEILRLQIATLPRRFLVSNDFTLYMLESQTSSTSGMFMVLPLTHSAWGVPG